MPTPRFDRSALNELVRAFMGLTSGDGAGLQFETLPWYDPGKPVGGQSVVLVKQPEADAVLAQLRGEAPAAGADRPLSRPRPGDSVAAERRAGRGCSTPPASPAPPPPPTRRWRTSAS